MQFQTFFNQIASISSIFGLNDLNVVFGQGVITAKQLSRWSKKGYLVKLKKGLYILAGHEQDVPSFLIANLGYQPSYISLESALYEYIFIPDVVMSITNVATRKTYEFAAMGTTFFYKQIKKTVFIGYGAKQYKGRNVLFAEPEKALLDYLYLHKPLLRDENDLEEARFNYAEMKNKINKKKLLAYTALFVDKRLLNLINKLIKNF